MSSQLPDEPQNIVIRANVEVPQLPKFTGLAPVSPRFSFKGWSLATWLVKNAGYVKGVLKVATTATGAIVVTDYETLRFVVGTWGLAAGAIAVGAFIDAVHYFFTENPA